MKKTGLFRLDTRIGTWKLVDRLATAFALLIFGHRHLSDVSTPQKETRKNIRFTNPHYKGFGLGNVFFGPINLGFFKLTCFLILFHSQYFGSYFIQNLSQKHSPIIISHKDDFSMARFSNKWGVKRYEYQECVDMYSCTSVIAYIPTSS